MVILAICGLQVLIKSEDQAQALVHASEHVVGDAMYPLGEQSAIKRYNLRHVRNRLASQPGFPT